jgi:hypothetical protein
MKHHTTIKLRIAHLQTHVRIQADVHLYIFDGYAAQLVVDDEERTSDHFHNAHPRIELLVVARGDTPNPTNEVALMIALVTGCQLRSLAGSTVTLVWSLMLATLKLSDMLVLHGSVCEGLCIVAREH